MQKANNGGELGRVMNILVLLLSSYVIAYAPQLMATQPIPETVGSFQAWDASLYDDPSGGQVCYIVSVPRQSQPQDVQRSEAYFMVTREPSGEIQDAVTVAVGYSYQEDSSVEVQIDSDSFNLVTGGEFAWVADKDALKGLIDAMIRGQNMTVSGTSTAGTRITDTYSLVGFTAARSAMIDACAP